MGLTHKLHKTCGDHIDLTKLFEWKCSRPLFCDSPMADSDTPPNFNDGPRPPINHAIFTSNSPSDSGYFRDARNLRYDVCALGESVDVARQTRVLRTVAGRCCGSREQYAIERTRTIRLDVSGVALGLSCAYVLHCFKKSFNCTTPTKPLNTQPVQQFALPRSIQIDLCVYPPVCCLCPSITCGARSLCFSCARTAILILAHALTHTHTKQTSLLDSLLQFD